MDVLGLQEYHGLQVHLHRLETRQISIVITSGGLIKKGVLDWEGTVPQEVALDVYCYGN